MNRRFLRRAVSHLMVGLMVLAVVAALLPLFFILGDLVAKGAGSLSFDFFTRTPAPAGETWKSTLWTPAPESLGEALSATVPRRYCPGSARPPPGAVASIVQVKEAGVGSTFPAASVARTWKVWLPSARPE